MKSLKDYITQECDASGSGVNATPSNTMGLGNPMAPDGELPGSGDTLDPKKKKKRLDKNRRYKDLHPDPENAQDKENWIAHNE